jgi:hypothetical protein
MTTNTVSFADMAEAADRAGRRAERQGDREMAAYEFGRASAYRFAAEMRETAVYEAGRASAEAVIALARLAV